MRKLGDRASAIALFALSAGTLYGLVLVSSAKKAGLTPPSQPMPSWFPGGASRPRVVTTDRNFEEALSSLDKK